MTEPDFLEDLHRYFHGEKRESVLILAGSCALLAAGAGILSADLQPFARGLASVLIPTGVIGGVVGGTIVLRTERQVAELSALYAVDRARFAEVEGPRIRTVVRSFRAYRGAYAAAVVAALALGPMSREPLFHGIAAGLLVFAALGFTVDHFAEARAIRYAARVHAQRGAP